MAIVEIDSYSEVKYSALVSLYAGANISVSQSFTVSETMTLYNCKLYLKGGIIALSSPVYAYIYAHSGTYGTSSVPTGAYLARSNIFYTRDLTTSFKLTTFDFAGANRISLQAGTYYTLVFTYDDGDINNRVDVGIDDSEVSHDGNLAIYSSVSGEWGADADKDTIFYVNGYDPDESVEFNSLITIAKAFNSTITIEQAFNSLITPEIDFLTPI